MGSRMASKFSVYLVCEDLIFGVALCINITYSQLVARIKKKFNLGDKVDVGISYIVGDNRVQIVDDDDVAFFVDEVCRGKSTVHNLLITKVVEQEKVIPSSSNSFGFDLNLFPEGYHENFDKSIHAFFDDPNPQKQEPMVKAENDLPYQHDENHFQNNQAENHLPRKAEKHLPTKQAEKLKTTQKAEIDLSDHHTRENWKTNTFKYMPPPPPHDPPVEHVDKIEKYYYNDKTSNVLKPGQEFDDKDECMYAIGKKAILDGKEFTVRKSDPLRYDVICKNKECKWKMISAKSKFSTKWVLGTVNDNHSCPKTQLNPNHRNASAKLLGHLLIPKVKGLYNRIYKAKDIQKDLNLEYNIDISYKKAWSGRNMAFGMLQGCPIKSFEQLPIYCHNLKLANEGMITHISTDDEDRFKMVFIGFGFAIRSFVNHMRPLIIIDAAHLKGTYLGTNLLAVGMDGNNQIIPIATGVAQGETGSAWTWFMSKLRECIGERQDLTIISDRHPSIQLACATVFPNSFHGFCCRHLMMNCKLRSRKAKAIYWKTCKAYTAADFQTSLQYLGSIRPEAYNKLVEAGVERWSRAYSAGNRYNYMTSNSAESINALTKDVRKVPITMLLEWYRGLLQSWYCDRRAKYEGDANGEELSPWAVAKIKNRMQKSANWIVKGIEHEHIYQVDDHNNRHQVQLRNNTCSCLKWQIGGLPCGHAIAVCRTMGLSDCNHLATEWYTRASLRATYQELVFPLLEESCWETPNNLQKVKPPLMDKQQAGRPKNTNRIPSLNEETTTPSCGRCGQQGHVRHGCKQPLPSKKKAKKTTTRGRSQTTQESQPSSQFSFDPINLADP